MFLFPHTHSAHYQLLKGAKEWGEYCNERKLSFRFEISGSRL